MHNGLCRAQRDAVAAQVAQGRVDRSGDAVDLPPDSGYAVPDAEHAFRAFVVDSRDVHDELLDD